MKLLKIITISGKIECITGLSIKGSNSDLNIGGADSEVIKNPLTGMPYIPGSSIKGKMRSQLEKIYGSEPKKEGQPCGCGKKDCKICTVFGAHSSGGRNSNIESAPVRIIVRDANLSQETLEQIKNKDFKDGNFLEVKSENSINRKSGTAEAPRFIERVPAGTKFDFKILLQIFEGDNEDELLSFVEDGLYQIENSYLGNSGSRGYGEVKFEYEIDTKELI